MITNSSMEEKSYFLIHQVRYKFILEKVKRIFPGKENIKVLDIGCYPYHIGKALENEGFKVFGIASKHEPIKENNVSILNIESEKFPFEDDFFDIVLFNEVIEHLPQSPLIPLREIYRVTKKGGYLIVTTPNLVRSINRLKLILGKTIMYPINVFFESNGGGNNIYHRHNREYILDELNFLISKMSWKIVEDSTFISYTPFRKKLVSDSLFLRLGKLANFLLMLMMPSLRDTLFLLAKK